MAVPERENLFLPSGDGGVRSRKRVNARLLESVEHVLERCAGHVAVDADKTSALLGKLDGANRVAPAFFGAFFDLVTAIHDRELEDVQVAVDHLFELDPAEAVGLRTRPLDRAHFSEDEKDALLRQFASESLLPEQIGPMDDEAAADACRRIARAISLLEAHAPQSHAEIEAVVSEIIPVSGDAVGGMMFDGCSSLERWGAILLNMNFAKGDLELAETLVHEGSHVALFGTAPVNFHVENGENERFKSPLRLDPRPMNGIYHATFVLARMAFAMHEVMASPDAPAELRREAAERAASDEKLFFDGYAVVAEHARFTPDGAAVMQDTAAYMSEASGA